jgi:hypothetical protein
VGLLSARRRRRAEREGRIRDEAYAKAVTKGQSPTEAATTAERAVRRHRRRRRLIIMSAGGSSGG